MRNRGRIQTHEPQDDPSIVIFLGLYLLLLAFFMMLNSISNIDSERATQAVDSVGKAFSEIKPPDTRVEEEMISEGAVLATNTFTGQVKAALASILRLAVVETLNAGQMRIETRVEDMFSENGESLIEDAEIFMKRLSRVMVRDENGMRREIEIILGVETMPETVDAGSSLELRQVSLFASKLIEKEVLPSSVSIGLSPGEAGNIVMFLTARPIESDEDGASQ